MRKMNLPEYLEIGEIPESWKAVRLEEIADVRAGAAFPKKYQGNTQGKYPFYKVSDMNLIGNETLMSGSNNWVEENTVQTLRAKLFPKNTVIFPKVGQTIHTNKKRMLSRDSLVDNNVMGVTIRDYDQCFPYYMLYWFEFIDLVDLSNPGPLPAITATTVKNTKIPLPPLPEQRAIAHVLQTIQDAKATRQREIALAREHKAALMDYLFSHGTTGEPRKQTEIGEIPKSWKILPFEACLKKLKPKKVSSIPKKDYQTAGDFPVIDQGASFISGWTNSVECIIFENLPVIIFGDHTRIFKYVDFPFAIGADGTKRLYANDDFLDARFFYYALVNLKVPNKGYNRHYRYLREFSVPCPPLPEQRAIAQVFQAIDEKIAALEQEVIYLDELFYAMLDELMTGQRTAVPLIDAQIV